MAQPRPHRHDSLEVVQKEAQPWHLAICDVDDTTTIIDMPPNTSVLTAEVMELVRDQIDAVTSKHWRLLVYMSTIEVGVASMEAILPQHLPSIEVVTRYYQRSPFLAAAFREPKLLSFLSSSDRLQEEVHAIHLASPTSVTVGSNVIVFRVSYGDLQNRLEVCGIAVIGFSAGVLAGLTTGKVDVGIAVAAAWFQFAQLVWARQHL